MHNDGAARRRLRILSTEDDPLVRAMLAELLSADGHYVEFARNSDDFFRLVDASPFDLLILDVNIPGLNGYQIAREISSRLGERRPKILMFTGRDTRVEKGLVAMAGADAVLEKGCPNEAILDAMARLLPPPAPAPAPKTAPPPAAARAAADAPEPALDRLARRVSAAVGENASLSHRLELMGKRVAELEKAAKKLRAGGAASRRLEWAFAFLALAFAALLFVFFLVLLRARG